MTTTTYSQIRKRYQHPKQVRKCKYHGETVFSWSGSGYTCMECRREICRKNKEYYKNMAARRRAGITGLGPRSKLPGRPNYTGLYIAETVLSKAFTVMEKAYSQAPYDFICGKGFKVDSKCSLLLKNNGKRASLWRFHINKNDVPDAFCLIALQNTPDTITDSPQIAYVWLIPGDALIEGRPLNDRMGISVSPSTVSKLEPYRRSDMEGKITTCCSNWKNPHLDHEVV